MLYLGFVCQQIKFSLWTKCFVCRNPRLLRISCRHLIHELDNSRALGVLVDHSRVHAIGERDPRVKDSLHRDVASLEDRPVRAAASSGFLLMTPAGFFNTGLRVGMTQRGDKLSGTRDSLRGDAQALMVA